MNGRSNHKKLATCLIFLLNLLNWLVIRIISKLCTTFLPIFLNSAILITLIWHKFGSCVMCSFLVSAFWAWPMNKCINEITNAPKRAVLYRVRLTEVELQKEWRKVNMMALNDKCKMFKNLHKDHKNKFLYVLWLIFVQYLLIILHQYLLTFCILR